ncbi:MAG: ABC transporter substrate-binding protein [Xanthobacteraceae bacterium]
MQRREFLMGVAGTALWPLAARAQQLSKVAKIGFLYPGIVAAAPTRIAAMEDGLRAVGIQKGQVEVVMRQADGDPSRMPALAAELVAAKVDVIMAISPSAVRAARSITTIPVVANDLETDPVASGLIASFAHPGGNITGVFFDFPDFATKWLELLKETLPQLSSLVAMWDPTTGDVQRKAIEAAARQLNVRLEVIDVRTMSDLESAFAKAAERRPDAVLMLSSPIFGTSPQRIADLCMHYRLPAISLFTEIARAGGLMAYGTNLLDTFRQTGTMVGKVVLGTSPADLPVERPSKFELVVNLKTAKILGVTVPTSVLLRADDVIE